MVLGPAFIKLGQAFSIRTDLISKELAESLAELQDAVPPFSNEEAFQTFQDEFGMKVEDVYDILTPNPIAAASLGQVYKAKLKSTGEIVALKV